MGSKTRRKGRRRRRHSWAKFPFVKRPQKFVVYPYTIDADHPKPVSWLIDRIAAHDQVCDECTISFGQTGERTWVLARAEMLNTGKKDLRHVTLNTNESDEIVSAEIGGTGMVFVLDDLIPELGWWSFPVA